jgi:hypothetical protein
VNLFSKILFWTITIALGFVNPLISVALVIVYYLPKIIQDTIQPCDESQNNFQEESEMKSFSDDVLEDMK